MIIIMLRVCVFLLNQTGPTVEAGHMLSAEVLVKEQAAAAKSAAAKKSTATAPKLATAKKSTAKSPSSKQAAKPAANCKPNAKKNESPTPEVDQFDDGGQESQQDDESARVTRLRAAKCSVEASAAEALTSDAAS